MTEEIKRLCKRVAIELIIPIIILYYAVYTMSYLAIAFVFPGSVLWFSILKYFNEMKQIKIKIKKTDPRAVTPNYAKPGDSCMDLTAISERIVEEDGYAYIEYDTGLAFEFPEDHTMLVFPRSSISNTGMILGNSVGVVDEGYRSSVKFRFKWVRGSVKYNVGDRVGQFMIIPRPKMVLQEVEELSETERGFGGHGSTGK